MRDVLYIVVYHLSQIVYCGPRTESSNDKTEVILEFIIGGGEILDLLQSSLATPRVPRGLTVERETRAPLCRHDEQHEKEKSTREQ